MASGFVFLFTAAASLPAAELKTELSKDQPSLAGGVAHLNPGSANGWAWKWTEADGRRDCGQYFIAAQTFPATDLAVQLQFSDPLRSAKKPEFRLLFLHFSGASIADGAEIMAAYTGTLPIHPGISHSEPAWFKINFPKVEFQKDERYGFLLQFTDVGGVEQKIVLKVTPSSTPDGGYGIELADGKVFCKSPSLNFILGQSSSAQPPAEAAASAPRTLLVDRRAASGLRTTAAAVAQARPGDTIRLAPGSGPYREILFIPQSGEPGKPITFDGAGETITGFEPLRFQKQGGEWVADLREFFSKLEAISGFSKKEGRWVGDVPNTFSAVIVYNGHRVLQDAQSAQLQEFARLSQDQTLITLLPGVDPDAWEISSRYFVVRILNASHQVYKNIKASGSLNDGYNLHGKGEDLVFENIEAFQNIDEGFSAHEDIKCKINGGRFWANDNGIGNNGVTPVNQCTLEAYNIRIYSNIGYGLWLSRCAADIDDLVSWGNGVGQIAFHGTSVVMLKNVRAVKPAWQQKPWLNYEESATRKDAFLSEISPSARCTGVIREIQNPED